ncbi:MAG TPA: glycosyltransferase family 2 protein [Polyangiales bacterium]|nr:glycosyltransferase family 2 protein [Polyangiales bacterium]
MMFLLTLAATVVAAILLAPALIFFVECIASVFLGSGARRTRPDGVSLVVLIPAHDESQGIGATIADVRSQLGPRDRIVVIADNCTDDTAEVARGAGAEVIERHAPEQRGKGYALAFGTDHLAADPPDLVLIVDADCRLTPGSVDALVEVATTTLRPVQADYVSRPVDRSPLSMISALAMLVRNRARPRGLLRLGLPCQLTGTGMAFPWPVLRAAPDLGAHLVEDLAVGIELALLGHEPLLCIEAGVRSELPAGRRAAMAQRRRWEHGQLTALFHYGPRLVATGMARGRLSLVAMGADLMVPPLALLVGLLVLSAAMSTPIVVFGGSAVPAWISVIGLTLVGIGVAAAWARYGRKLIPFRYLLLVPLYLAWKIPLYAAFLLGRRERRWQRTER